MTPSNEDIRDAIAQQATDWFVTHQSDAQDVAENAAFMNWIRTSPAHVEEYLGLAALSRDLRTAVMMDPNVAGMSTRSPARSPTKAPAWWSKRRPQSYWWSGSLVRSAITCAAVLLGLGVVWFAATTPANFGQRYASDRKGQMSWSLPDGSSVQLSSDSAVQMRFGRTERVVEAEHGQAYFRVAKDSLRRFRVTAGAAPTSPVSADLKQSEAWRSERIVVEQRPLGEVTAEFSRYASVPIEVADPVLRGLLVSGNFKARDTSSFIAFLRATDKVVVRATPTQILVLRRAAPSAQRNRIAPGVSQRSGSSSGAR